MKRHMDWIDVITLIVIGSFATVVLGWGAGLMMGGVGLLSYVRERYLRVTDDEIDSAINMACPIYDDGRRGPPLCISGADARGIRAALHWHGFDIVRQRIPHGGTR